jgi:hypothetical protein
MIRLMTIMTDHEPLQTIVCTLDLLTMTCRNNNQDLEMLTKEYSNCNNRIKLNYKQVLSVNFADRINFKF